MPYHMRTKTNIAVHSFVRHCSCMTLYYSIYTTIMPQARLGRDKSIHGHTCLAKQGCGVT